MLCRDDCECNGRGGHNKLNPAPVARRPLRARGADLIAAEGNAEDDTGAAVDGGAAGQEGVMAGEAGDAAGAGRLVRWGGARRCRATKKIVVKV